ncbi:MAG TPA: transcription-repair coupling factor [Bacilli bacterium]|nr:transcription-repair coupling factor [Bacilli bacterium]
MSIFNTIFENNKEVYGLTDELKAIYLKNIYEENNKSILFVTNSLYEANKIYQLTNNYTSNVLLFPMDDFLTSEALATSPELKINRIETIKQLLTNNKYIIITNLMGLLRFLPDKDLFKNKTISLEKGKQYNIKELENNLFNIGYDRETLVNKTGDFSVRGYVIDIFPIFEEYPIRIEFWGDEIDSIRIFDINNQLTIKNIESIDVFPISEFLIEKDVDITNLTHKDLINYEKVFSIYDYVDDICIFNDYNQLYNSYKNLMDETINYSIDSNLPATTLYMNKLEDLKIINKYDFISFDSNESINKKVKKIKEINKFPTKSDEINEILNKYLKQYETVVLCISNSKRANKLIEELKNKNIILTNEDNIYNDKINLIIHQMNKGFIYDNRIFICERDIFSFDDNKIYKTKFKLGTKIRDLSKLNVGDYVVHSMHGIGKYCGLKTLEKNGLSKDYLLIEYRDSDKLYIPVEKIDMINKYSSKEGYAPRLNKLGSSDWEKTKFKAKQKIEDIALELLNLYALRESIVGFAYPKDDQMQIDFEKEFNYNETEDQIKVLEEIKNDMESPHPMDRLLCGDVGYGKTEVAFRAIFKAILGGKQAAILCPTTILSNQHFQNAKERFKSFSVNIEILNRFVTPKKAAAVLKRLKEGKIDLLIGTHRILSDDVIYKDLGLLVVDEEQRFGVKHKEKIKEYKNIIDVLTLSATPIPRTLQMSMTGLRSLSLIETPPMDRYPIQTYVLSENNSIIKDAIYKELSRQGQCFILYNDIEMLYNKKIELSRLVPDAKIEIAHGQMNKTELEDIMERFNNKEFNVLLCTTIIETGIDIPNVNTLIIYNADRFGLSQLYQIRGRVGRSNKIAYCYLMYNKSRILSEIATKRLKAIKEFTELGSGFAIAMRDLSIRGAGDILGSRQAGFVDSIGIELFMEMLNNEINRLKGIETKTEESEELSQPLVDVETSINDNYVTEEELKIEIHKKINEIDSLEKLNKTKAELEDRFGRLSDNTIIYMYEEWFEKLAKSLNINKIRQTKNNIIITIDSVLLEKINVQELFSEVILLSRMFRFSMQGKNMLITLDIVKLDKHFIYYLIDLLNIIKKNKED